MQLRKQAEFKSVKVQEIISEYKNLNKKKIIQMILIT